MFVNEWFQGCNSGLLSLKKYRNAGYKTSLFYWILVFLLTFSFKIVGCDITVN